MFCINCYSYDIRSWKNKNNSWESQCNNCGLHWAGESDEWAQCVDGLEPVTGPEDSPEKQPGNITLLEQAALGGVSLLDPIGALRERALKGVISATAKLARKRRDNK